MPINIAKLNGVKNISDWWKLENEMKKSHAGIGNTLNINIFYIHFSNLLAHVSDINPISWCVPSFIDRFLDSPFELREFLNVLNNAKLNKAPGQDRLSYEFYINAPPSFLTEILALFNVFFLAEEFRDTFRQSIIISLFIKGDINDVAYYRGLPLLDSSYKLFTGLLLSRLISWIECHAILYEYQAGFRKGYSTVDNIFNLTSIINLKLH